MPAAEYVENEVDVDDLPSREFQTPSLQLNTTIKDESFLGTVRKFNKEDCEDSIAFIIDGTPADNPIPKDAEQFTSTNSANKIVKASATKPKPLLSSGYLDEMDGSHLTDFSFSENTAGDPFSQSNDSISSSVASDNEEREKHHVNAIRRQSRFEEYLNGKTPTSYLVREEGGLPPPEAPKVSIPTDSSPPKDANTDASQRRQSRFEAYVSGRTDPYSQADLSPPRAAAALPENPTRRDTVAPAAPGEIDAGQGRQSRFEAYNQERTVSFVAPYSARAGGGQHLAPVQESLTSYKSSVNSLAEPGADYKTPLEESGDVKSQRRQSRFDEYYKERSASFVAPFSSRGQDLPVSPSQESPAADEAKEFQPNTQRNHSRVHFHDVDASTLTSYQDSKEQERRAGAAVRRQSRFEDYVRNDKRFSAADFSTSTSVATPDEPRRHQAHAEEEEDHFEEDWFGLSPERSRSRRFTNAVINAEGDQHFDRRVSAFTHVTGLDSHKTGLYSDESAYGLGGTGKNEYRSKTNTTFCVVCIFLLLMVAGVVPVVVCGILGECSSFSSNDANDSGIAQTNDNTSSTINPDPPTVVITTVPPRPTENNSSAEPTNANIDFVEVELGTSGATLEIPNYTLQKLDDPMSSQANAYLWLIYTYAEDVLVEMPMWRRQQLFALTTFYFSFRGDRWDPSDQQGWLDPSVHECQWSIDIVCYFEPESASLNLPPPVGGGSGAQNVDLQGRVRGIRMLDFKAPIELSSMVGVTGVPPELELLQWIQVFELHGLGGLESTSLEALMPFQELAHIPFLASLGATENQMTGTLPTELGLLTQLRFLGLYQNQFTGMIPSELGMLTDLDQVWLDNNDLTGTVPASVCDLTLIRNGLDVDIDCEEVTCPAGCNCDCASHAGR